MTLLEIEGLRTWFETEAGTARAVDGVSLSMEEGEAVGLVGESGCGKTVTALSLMGLVPGPTGRIRDGSSIRLRGRELVGLAKGEMREVRGRKMAMVFQEPMTALNPVLPVGEQVGEALRFHEGVSGKEARRAAVRLLQEVGIPDPERRMKEYPHRLSGGMRQRVCLAIALSCGPELLIADEPTTALDVTIQAQILELLADLRRRRGMALLLISHDLSVVGRVCDRVAVMYGGRIVETGPVAAVFGSPRHPYTRGLLRSLPRVGGGRRRLEPIPGAVPEPTAWPSGCRFRTRCAHAWERCAREEPPLISAGDEGLSARCWLEEEPERREAVEPGEGRT